MLPDDWVKQDGWNWPPRVVCGDVLPEDLYRHVGQALSRWEALEADLGEAFRVLIEARSEAAVRVYGGMACARNRQDALGLAAEIFFLRDDRRLAVKPDFMRLRKAVGLASARRNDIAHGIVVSYAGSGVPNGGYFLCPAMYNTRRNETGYKVDMNDLVEDPFSCVGHSYALIAAQPAEISARFGQLSKECINVSRALAAVSLIE